MTEKDDEKAIDIITDQERDIAQNAYAEFKKKNYTNCLQQIGKLDRSHDLKVVHNKAVVEYYKNDFKKTENFQKTLTAICSQFKIKLDKLDDVDHCIEHYNQAILLYHQRQYTAAQRIMDRVYKFIEPMEESLAKQVSLFAIELQLCIRQPDKALSLINYLENNLLNNNPVVGKNTDKSTKEKEKKVQTSDPIIEEFKKKLIKYKVRCYIMNHNLNTALTELQLLPKGKSNVDSTFMMANLEYLNGNLNEAMKLLSSIGEGSLDYMECGESSSIMCNNNIGVIMHAKGKPNLACHYFQEALKKDIELNSNIKEAADRPLYTLGGSKYHEMMYNLGIAMLHAGKPSQAFECLIIAVRRYHRNSRLWMRLAECCIMVHKESNEIDILSHKKQNGLVVDIIGSREKQKIVLSSNLSKDKKYSAESQSYAVPVPSLEFASLCLRNAHLLLPSDTASSPVPLFLIPGVTPPAPPPSPGPAPSNPLSADGIIALKNHILVTSAYVSLCLGDYILALEYSRTLLEQSKLPGGQKLLAHLYAAESLVLLSKFDEALEHLNPENVKDIAFVAPSVDFTCEESTINTGPPPKWFPTNLASAHIVMQYNIAVAKTIRGQLDQASSILKLIWQRKTSSSSVPIHVIMLVIYIELRLGHADVARNLIKQYSLQHRISG